MKRLLINGLLLLLLGSTAFAADGFERLASAHPVDRTSDRLAAALEAAGFTVFARIDHAAGARSVDLALPPTELLVFGKPAAGTRLMQAGPTVGIDLPLKYLVWATEDGDVAIGWNDPAWLARRHGIAEQSALLEQMAGAVRKFAAEAAQAP